MSWSSCSVYDESLLQRRVPIAPRAPMARVARSGSSGADGAGGDSGGVGGTAGTGGGRRLRPAARRDDGAACPPTAGPWWGKVNSYGCQTTGRPKPEDRPPAACEGPSIAPILLAVNRLRLANVKNDAQLTRDPEAWRDIGLDIDDSCTKSETCTVPPDGGDAGSAADARRVTPATADLAVRWSTSKACKNESASDPVRRQPMPGQYAGLHLRIRGRLARARRQARRQRKELELRASSRRVFDHHPGQRVQRNPRRPAGSGRHLQLRLA